MAEVDELLNERKSTHGEYADHAALTQGLLGLMMASPNWGRLSAMQRETVHMTCHKLGRIGVGDPDEPDHWADIAGYNQLIVQRLPKREAQKAYEDDFYALLSKAWGVEREEVKRNVLAYVYGGVVTNPAVRKGLMLGEVLPEHPTLKECLDKNRPAARLEKVHASPDGLGSVYEFRVGAPYENDDLEPPTEKRRGTIPAKKRRGRLPGKKSRKK